jgi:hypothetical protein
MSPALSRVNSRAAMPEKRGSASRAGDAESAGWSSLPAGDRIVVAACDTAFTESDLDL